MHPCNMLRCAISPAAVERMPHHIRFLQQLRSDDSMIEYLFALNVKQIESNPFVGQQFDC
jgi:hypothetical protein